MAQVLLKSRALRLFDHTSVNVDEFVPEFTVDEKQLEKDINRILKTNGIREDADVVEEGDEAVITCSSDIPKFNKKGIKVIIGRGLFSKELEKGLIGMHKDGSFELKVDGNPVTGTVNSIIHTVLPELTDDNVSSFGIDGVSTVRGLRRYCIDKQIDRILDDSEERDDASALVWSTLAADSEFELDEEDIAAVHHRAEAKIAEMEQSGNDSFDDWGMDYKEMIMNMFMTELKTAVIGQEVALGRGEILDDDDYEAYIAGLKSYYTSMSDEELMAQHSKTDYAISRYGDVICKVLDDYVSGAFKEKMNPLRG